MPASTPISLSKTAALSRVLDSIPKGYRRYTCGTIRPNKVDALLQKFHHLYGIGCTPAQRLTRKSHGKANALMVVFWPEGATEVQWLLLATHGTGLEGESLMNVEDKNRLNWLDYECVRYANRNRTSWTWRRPKHEMAEHYLMLSELMNKHYVRATADFLLRLTRQPGYHGVREQTWAIFQEARRRGYTGELPYIFFVQKTSHGERRRIKLGKTTPS